jgi:hypothetical protein
MSTTLAVRPHRSHRWIYVTLLVAAIVATTVLALVAFTGSSGDASPTKVPAGAHVPAPHDPCMFAGDRRMGC